jgi:hypothetical protein
MSKNVQRIPWIFDAAGQMEGKDRSGTYPGLPGTRRTYGTFTSAATDITTMAEHGLSTGFGPVQVTTSAADLPSGLTTSTDYWISKIDRDTFYFCSSHANAIDGTAVTIADAGTGTHTMTAYNVFNFPLYIEQIKVDTGDGGNFLITWDSDAQARQLKLDNTPADDTLWVPIKQTVEAIYVQTLPTNATIEVYPGEA